METNNLGYLRKQNIGNGGDVEKEYSPYAHLAYMNLIDEHMLEFGITSDQKREIELKKKLFNLYYDFINADTPKARGRIQNEIFFAKEDINILNKGKKKSSFNYKKEVGIIGKSLGRSIDTLTTTVYQYYLDKKSLENA
jgi:hypothetical protein